MEQLRRHKTVRKNLLQASGVLVVVGICRTRHWFSMPVGVTDGSGVSIPTTTNHAGCPGARVGWWWNTT